METVQHVSPGMPTQAQLSYGPRPSLQYNLSNPNALPLGGSSSFKVSATSTTANPAYPGYPSSSDLPAPRYVSQTSQYGIGAPERSNSNSSSSYSENNNATSVIGRSERGSNPSSISIADYVTPKSRAILNSSEHRNTHVTNRINSNESYLDGSLGSSYHADHGAPPNKRIKYNELNTDIQLPLKIDTERIAYNPPVEAISPTLPPASLPSSPPAPPPNQGSIAPDSPDLSSEINQKHDDTVMNLDSYNLSNSPSELVDLLKKVEEEIVKADQQIQQLKKKQKEIEDTSNFRSTGGVVDVSEESILPKFIRVARKIYDDNWKRALKAHEFFNKFGPLDDLPIYNQAPDTEIYHENRKKYAILRPHLIDNIRKEKVAKETRDQNIATAYNKLSAEWKRKVEKVESSQKRKTRDLKNREGFEKVFPELRKQREDKERFSRSGGRVRSEADLEEIMDGLQEQELEDKKMRSYAVIPPLMLNLKQRRYSFINNNGLIRDLPKTAKENEYYNIWTDAEKEVFKEKFLQHPKNFGVIASYLEKKSVCECVAFYYMSKKTEHYKRLLRKSRRTRTRNLHSKANGANAVGLANSSDILYNNTPGVTTRLQREQIQQQQRLEQPQNLSVLSTSNASSISVSLSIAASSVTEPSTIDSCVSERNDTLTCGTVTSFSNESEVQPSSSLTLSATSRLASEFGDKTLIENEHENDPEIRLNNSITDEMGPGLSSMLASSSVTASNNSSEMKADIKKKERRKEDKKKNDNNSHVEDTSEEDILLATEGNEKGATHPCLICKTEAISSRALAKGHAQQYGLKEEDVTAGARVCNLCRCKAVRLRCTPCPLPTCPNTKGSRVKRLRPLPCKWTELPQHIKQPVITEFQVPSTATKCCSACFNRIQRRLVALGVVPTPQTDDTSGSSTTGSQLLKWTEDETEALRRGLSEHGTKWSDVAQVVGPSKSQYQCKTFYFNYRKKLGLDAAIQQYKKHVGDERKPTLSTDEEESGSTTSSCDELDRPMADDSDTASAPSPQMNNSSEVLESAVITKSEDANLDNATTPNTSTAALGNASPLKCTQPVICSFIAKEDYDSSATETADEGIGTAVENEGTATKPTLENTKASSMLSNIATSGGEREIMMADVMHDIIEFQLKKPASQLSNPSQVRGPNSISSIVDQNLIECDLRQQKARENSLATLSVVSSVQHLPSHHEMMKENVVYLQMSKEAARDSEMSGTLDLSMKKSRSPDFMSNHKMHGCQVAQPSAGNGADGGGSGNGNSCNMSSHIPLLTVPPHQATHPYKHSNMVSHEAANSYYHGPQLIEVARVSKSGGESLYPWKTPMSQSPVVAGQPLSMISVKQPPSSQPKKLCSPHQLNQNVKLSPKQSPNGAAQPNTITSFSLNQPAKFGGSIMQGTPVSNANLYPANLRDNRYDSNLLRQITPPSHQTAVPLAKESGGSITQGTPVHQRSLSHSNSSAEYYPQSNNKRTAPLPSTNFYPTRPHSYNDEHRQQIIMTDFVTSKQLCNMQQRDKSTYYYPTPRQGVIQRHNATSSISSSQLSKPLSPHSYPPGHEAFSSLVDVAVRQPSLPVPLAYPNSALKEDKRLIIQEGLGERFLRDVVSQDRYPGRELRDSREASMHHQSMHHEQQLRGEHAMQQIRESQLQRERDQRQQDQILREHQFHKLREEDRLRDQSKHLLPQSMRENHVSQQAPSFPITTSASCASVTLSAVVSVAATATATTTGAAAAAVSDRTAPPPPPPHLLVDSHPYAGRASRMNPDAHLRLPSMPTSAYPVAYRSAAVDVTPDSRNVMQALSTTSSVANFHRDTVASSPSSSSSSPSSVAKTETTLSRPLNANSRSVSSSGGDSNTLTAASLIDAIITHQINQPSDNGNSTPLSQSSTASHVPAQRPGEKLFQVFPEPDGGKLSPLKCGPGPHRASPDMKIQSPLSQPQASNPSPTPSAASPASSNAVSSTSTVTSSPATPTTSVATSVACSVSVSVSSQSQSTAAEVDANGGGSCSKNTNYESHAWKLRRALQQQKEMEQADRNIVRMAATQRPSSPREIKAIKGCPFDYVKNRIVEVMHRASDDESGKTTPTSTNGCALDGNSTPSDEPSIQQASSSYLPASNYAYPYSALNINSQVPVSTHSVPATTSKPVDVPEPTPILSSQYEPLSDED